CPRPAVKRETKGLKRSAARPPAPNGTSLQTVTPAPHPARAEGSTPSPRFSKRAGVKKTRSCDLRGRASRRSKGICPKEMQEQVRGAPGDAARAQRHEHTHKPLEGGGYRFESGWAHCNVSGP